MELYSSNIHLPIPEGPCACTKTEAFAKYSNSKITGACEGTYINKTGKVPHRFTVSSLYTRIIGLMKCEFS